MVVSLGSCQMASPNGTSVSTGCSIGADYAVRSIAAADVVVVVVVVLW